MTLALRLLADPPLDPTRDEGRTLLRRELLRPEYNDQNLVDRFFRWVQRAFDSGVQAASSAPAWQTVAAIIVFLVLLLALGWLASQARGSSRATSEGRAVLTDETVTAAQLRTRAEAALRDGRNADALVDAFRALAVRQIERGRLDDVPGATAHEVADNLAATYPHQRPRVDGSAVLFDSVLYGDRPATSEQAASVLALDDDLAGAR